MKRGAKAFTIVELLVVIVVIAILAAITIVAYSNITGKAAIASLTSDLDTAARLLKMDQVTNMTFPNTLAEANGGKGVPASSGTTYFYAVNNGVAPVSFCMTATNGQNTYMITNNSSPVEGNCMSYGLEFFVDASNSSSYPGSGTTWTDLSGNNQNVTLYNGVGFSSSGGGALTFNGVDQYGTYPVSAITINTNFSASMWVYITGDGTLGANGFMNGKAFRLFAYNSNNIMWSQINGATPYSDNSLTALSRNQWTNIGLSYDGTNRSYYVNGVLAKQNATTGVPLNTHGGQIGTIQGVSYAYNGLIGGARLYNRLLVATEFQQIFNAEKTKYGL